MLCTAFALQYTSFLTVCQFSIELAWRHRFDLDERGADPINGQCGVEAERLERAAGEHAQPRGDVKPPASDGETT